MPQLPEWRNQPELIWIRCNTVNKVEQNKEYVVQFKTNGGEYTAFVPEQFIDDKISGLKAYIVADIGDSCLVDIPVETLTSGSRIRLQNCEKNSVIVPA